MLINPSLTFGFCFISSKVVKRAFSVITAAGNVIAPDMKGVTLRQANVNEVRMK